MGKFDNLEAYLSRKTEEVFTLSFITIEDILRFKLEKSAYKYPAYWSVSETHSLPKVVLSCGYKMSPDLHDKQVCFIRVGTTTHEEKHSENKAVIKEAITTEPERIDISKYVGAFTKIYHLDVNSRYKSFDNIRNAFLQYRADYTKRDYITLQLYAYLASWGMLRNSFLRQKDYSFSRPVVDLLCNEKYDALLSYNPFKKTTTEEAKLIMNLADEIRACYLGTVYHLEGNNKQETVKSVSDTLVSKIILGTFGCTVAYDRYVKAGLSSLNMRQGLCIRSILELNQLAMHNKEEIEPILCELNNLYTPMKILDMFLYEKGFAQSESKKD